MRYRVDIDRAALDKILRNRAYLRKIGNTVRDTARQNVSPHLKGNRADRPEEAIISQIGEDAQSAYVDVGYRRRHPGFYLWWYEVGTQYAPASPHLRPALRPGLFD